MGELIEGRSITEICRALADGKSLNEISKRLGVAHADLWEWIIEDDRRRRMYNESVGAGNELMKAKLIDELKYIAFSDIRQIYNKHTGQLNPPDQWPDEAAAAVKSIKVSPDGTVTIQKNDKLRAIEIVGRQLDMFKENKGDNVLNLEQIIIQSAKEGKDEGRSREDDSRVAGESV